ncbi:hypothetical protein [Micromonospora sp. HUAS LYJ1]|uniref:hypothetical protein n=1 Tax=Micromonospora sp. HUAS LYJ1 TaxID=3061626 RepID=UPI002673CBE8|nr:hypothetical protein [Micromonospora sp. HUAS LYJ1]WKU03857.1 hypothetical protein Q2K16_23905 [Micromonospora sp. HUAS LYJ1]
MKLIPQSYPLFLGIADPDHPDPESTIKVRAVVAWRADPYDDLLPMVIGESGTPSAVQISDEIGPLFAYEMTVEAARRSVGRQIEERKRLIEQRQQRKPHLTKVDP